MEIHGHCDEQFAPVRETFERNFAEHGDVGASFAASLEGELVVDLWGGHRDAARTLPWQRDTIVNVFSTTKTMSFLCALILADRGELDFYAPVERYWPEYATNGKEKTEVRHFLSHSAGVPGFEPRLAPGGLYDWDACVANLAAQTPWWEPGTQSGYHAVTQGYLIGELVRRITGKSLGTFFRDEVATPLDADFHIGVGDEDFARIAEIIPMAQPEGGSLFANLDPQSIPARVFGAADLAPGGANSPEWRRAEIPAANGHGNARAVVRAQTALANAGKAFGIELLSDAGCRRIVDAQIEGPDAVLMLPIRFGMGYAFSSEIMPLSPNPHGMFWGGAGGSTIVVDQDAHVCLSYVMNQMQMTIVGDSRGLGLGNAFYACL